MKTEISGNWSQKYTNMKITVTYHVPMSIVAIETTKALRQNVVFDNFANVHKNAKGYVNTSDTGH